VSPARAERAGPEHQLGDSQSGVLTEQPVTHGAILSGLVYMMDIINTDIYMMIII